MRRLQLVWGRGLGRRQKRERALEAAGVQARLGSGKRTPHPLRGIARQNNRAMQERRCRGQAAARLRAAGGLLERRGNRLVRPRRGCGQMPRATVGFDAAVGRLRQGQMDVPALLSGRRSVDRGAHQRMTEGHALADHQQPVGLRLCRGRRRDPEPLGRAPQQQRIADRLSRRDQQQTPRVVRQRLKPTNEALLDPSRQRLRAHQTEAAGQLRRRQPPRQLQQRQRIPPRLGDDPVPDSLIQSEPDSRAQQRAGVAVVHAAHLQLGEVSKLLPRFTRGEHDPDGLRQQAPGDKRQRQRRGLIQPLRVIDDAQQWTLFGRGREQAQHGQPDEEPIGSGAGAQPEHDLQGPPLRVREFGEPVEQRRAQLMQTGEAQLHVRLHPDRPDDRQI